jgi:AAA domain
MESMVHGEYGLIVLDAFYRILPGGMSENDNAAMAAIYNQQDHWAASTGSAIENVHHTTKGTQGEKDVTDVGAGAGSQSRAADTHLILRPHQEPGCVVLDAAVRSWPPVEPIGLRWQFPLWVVDEGLKVELLKGRLSKGEEKAVSRDAEADKKVVDACQDWRTRGEIRRSTGFGDDRLNRAILRLIDSKFIETELQDRPRNPGSEVFRKTIYAS